MSIKEIACDQRAIDTFHTMYLNDEKKVSKDQLKKCGIYPDTDKFQITNLTFEKLFLSDNFEISLTDKRRDLNGILISDHPRLLEKLQSHWFHNKKSISWDEMKELNIYTSMLSIEVGNFFLDSNLGVFGKSYSISLIDKRKDEENKWIDNEINVKRVLDELERFISEKHTISSEKNFEDKLYNFLESKFRTVDLQVSIGGVKALKIDIDLGNGRVGLELKLADKLINSTEKQRFIGQMHDYTTKRYKPENFILAVAGDRKLRSNTTLKEVKQLVEQNSHFVFIEV